MGPEYLCTMFKFANFNHCIYLTAPRVLSQYGERSFHKVGTKLWNELPLDIKTSCSLESFKATLKTYLFRQAFDMTAP